MPIKRPPAEKSAPDSTTEQPGQSRRTDVDINTRLDDYIAKSPADFERYTNLVKDDPAYAVRSLMLKDMTRFEDRAGLVAKLVPEAKKFLESLPPEEQEKIQAKVDSVDPMFRDSRLVREVNAYMDRQAISENRKKLMPKPGARVAA